MICVEIKSDGFVETNLGNRIRRKFFIHQKKQAERKCYEQPTLCKYS